MIRLTEVVAGQETESQHKNKQGARESGRQLVGGERSTWCCQWQRTCSPLHDHIWPQEGLVEQPGSGGSLEISRDFQYNSESPSSLSPPPSIALWLQLSHALSYNAHCTKCNLYLCVIRTIYWLVDENEAAFKAVAIGSLIYVAIGLLAARTALLSNVMQ